MEKIQNSAIIQQLFIEAASGMNKTSKNISGTESISAWPSCLKAFKAFFEGINSALTNPALTIDNMLAEGNRVLVRYTISGVHQADFMGVLPSHRPTAITGVDIFRLDNGRVVEHWDAAHQIISIQHRYPRHVKPVHKLSPAGVA
jgi:predicted ester cyclase